MVIIVQVVQNTSYLHGSIQVLQMVDHVKCQHFLHMPLERSKGSDDQLYVLHYIAACRWLPEDNVATHIPWRTVSTFKYDPKHHDPSACTYSRNFQLLCCQEKGRNRCFESLGYVYN